MGVSQSSMASNKDKEAVTGKKRALEYDKKDSKGKLEPPGKKRKPNPSSKGSDDNLTKNGFIQTAKTLNVNFQEESIACIPRIFKTKVSLSSSLPYTRRLLSLSLA